MTKASNFEIKLHINNTTLTAEELTSIIERAIDKESVIAEVYAVTNIGGDSTKQQRTAMELSDSLVREIRYYCEENGIDTTLGFELAKSIRRENDLVATYVDLGEDGYADWISDIITNHFEEEKEESVNMTNKEHALVMELARMSEEKHNLEIVLGCMEAIIECSDGVPLDQPAHHNAKYTMGELVTVYEMIRQGRIQLVPVK